jgi:hypothetical protein
MPVNRSRKVLLFTLIMTLAVCATVHAGPPTPEHLEFFESKIRPLLADKCFKCHGPEKQRAELRLDSRDFMLKGGENGPVLVPGNAEKTTILKAVGYKDPDLRMPPDSKLAEQQIQDLETWVKMGAPWPDMTAVTKKVNTKEFNLQERAKHWAFQPMNRPDLPAVKNQDWPLSPIDHFILAKLEKAGLEPNPQTDKRTLLRRVYFDLIGLPPSPNEIDDFLKDDSPAAFEKVVDRLLASPHYGERWGRHWLDLVRFAETAGHEFDFEIPEAWRYRDYVIRAFNADVPYDRFVIEHIAGDLLARPRLHPVERFNESIIGTGFFHLGEGKHSPVDIRGDQADRLDNQIDVFSKTFLALTLSCARCHDHKFDPIRTKDYYAMMGYLQSSRFQMAFIDDPAPLRKKIGQLDAIRKKMAKAALPETAALLKMQVSQVLDAPNKLRGEVGNNIRHPLYPLLVMGDDKDFAAKRVDLLKQLRALKPDSAAYETFADYRRGDYEEWFSAGEAFRLSSASDVIFQPNALRPVQALAGSHSAHSGLISNNLQGTLRSPTFVLSKKYIHYRLRGHAAKLNLIIDGFQLIRNPIYGGLTIDFKDNHAARWFTQDVSMWPGHWAYVELLDHGPGYIALEQVVFSDSPQPPPEPANGEIEKLLAAPSPQELVQGYRSLLPTLIDDWAASKQIGPDRAAILNTLLQSAAVKSMPVATKDTLPPRMAAWLKEYRQLETTLPAPTKVLAMQDGTPINEKVFIRGNHKKLGEEAPRQFLEVFAGIEEPVEDSSGRLELAQEIVAPANPLTARVMVNRIWKHHFAEGIVRSVDNFGLLGTEPTNPELLDWLATEFIRQGWSIKKMHKLMLLSRTYQMSSKQQPAAKNIDPENKLLHRMSVHRLEGEIIRDALLAISGRLNPKMYGPGVLPHLTPFMAGRGRPGASGPLDGDGVRSIYINVRRNFLTPMFLVFDYPLPSSTMGKRSVSNVPAQALSMMNNPFVIQQTDLWAKKILAQPALSKEQRIERLFEEALGRLPSEAELRQMTAFLEEQSQVDGSDEGQAWRDLCHVIVNLKEFIYIQ